MFEFEFQKIFNNYDSINFSSHQHRVNKKIKNYFKRRGENFQYRFFFNTRKFCGNYVTSTILLMRLDWYCLLGFLFLKMKIFHQKRENLKILKILRKTREENFERILGKSWKIMAQRVKFSQISQILSIFRLVCLEKYKRFSFARNCFCCEFFSTLNLLQVFLLIFFLDFISFTSNST